MTASKNVLILLCIFALPLAACETGGEEDLTVEGAQNDTTALGGEQSGMQMQNGMFADYDANQDQMLDEQEFGEAGYFSQWDTDMDSTLTQTEFQQGITDAGLFENWDADDSGFLTQEEFGYDNEGWFSEWDADGNQELTQDEFAEGAFGTFDENADDAIGEDEFLGIWDFDESGGIEQQEYRDAQEWLG